MKNWGFKTFLFILFLFSIAACAQKEEGQPQGAVAPSPTETATPQQAAPTPGAPTGPSITISPTPPATPPSSGGTTGRIFTPTGPLVGITSPSPGGTAPIPPLTGGTTPTQPPSGGGTGGRTPLEPATAAPDQQEVPIGISPPRDFDITVILEKIYDDSMYLQQNIDPLSGIRPIAGNMRFKKTASENSLAVNFNVTVPVRSKFARLTNPLAPPDPDVATTPTSACYSSLVRPLDWFQFNLLACDSSDRCQIVMRDLRPANPSAACLSVSGNCELTYNVTIQGSQIPGAAIEANHHYAVEMVATPQADYINVQCRPFACLTTADCMTIEPVCITASGVCTTYPICTAGLCNAIKSGKYFRAMTPTVLATARP